MEREFDGWFGREFGVPTRIQQLAWPVIRRREHALVIAPTGQGKSLAAWRPLIERLVGDGVEGAETRRRPSSRVRTVRALHIAPLKALARDMTHNLAPLLRFAGELCGNAVTIALRCGDTPPAERLRQKRRPPEILSTTPESIFVLLGSAGGRALLETVEAIVVDEIHALAPGKRGAHLALSLARLDRLCGRSVQRIGLSATAAPGRALARFLGGEAECALVDCAMDDYNGRPVIELELPEAPLGPFVTTVHWQQAHARIAELAADAAGRSTLVFCQTRAQVERTSAALGELLGAENVGAHHGSLDTAHREAIEGRFRDGRLKVMISSASLELGLDLGAVDRVCQLGIPGSVNLLRQRAGRSGHRPGGRPRIHLFALTLNQLVEAGALRSLLGTDVIERTQVPRGPLDVAAQHIAAIAATEGPADQAAILAVLRAARPYRDFSAGMLERLVAVLGEPPQQIPGPQRTPLVRRTRDGRLAGTPGADRIVLANAGVIPEFFEYEVVRADTNERVGRLDEEFAFESSPGQILQLGHRAWRILAVRTGEVRVEPADEVPGNLPFWFGEGPGRSPELASTMLAAIETGDVPPQARRMLDEARAELGALPGRDTLIVERFHDPGGDRHIVLHTFAGARINRAWGLALRKRFCRRFNFELQAAATDDGILISLGVTSTFDVGDVTGFVRSHNASDVLVQALLDTPLFVTRFRWCANNALLLPRRRVGGSVSGAVPPQQQRSAAENLIACVFPDQLACLENLTGPREIPDHPLVQQALDDCLNEHMDLPGLIALLGRIEQGAIRVHAVDLDRPSPLAEALIHAPRYSFLDEAAAEERRTRVFEGSTGRARGNAARLVSPNPKADPRSVRSAPRRAPVEAGPGRAFGTRRASADALERLLLEAGFLTAAEGELGFGLCPPVPAGGWSRHFSQLVRERRALSVQPPGGRDRLWIAAERVGWLLELNPALEVRPWLSASLVREPPGGVDAVRRWLIDSRRRIDGDNAPARVERLFGIAGGSGTLADGSATTS